MAQKAAIKSRIKSINATKKITGAMKLIATVKLQKERNKMLKNREYLYFLKNTMNQILSGNIDVESDYLKHKGNPKSAVIVFCSDLGLCGGYNINVSKLSKEVINENDDVYVIGTSIYKELKNNFNVVNELVGSDNITFQELKKLSNRAINDYKNNLVGSIKVVYTKFINNVSFETSSEMVLPCSDKVENTERHGELLLEPDPSSILESLIPMYVENDIYSKWQESKTSEQASRRFAMENATDNANELTEELLLAYNQARQAAITQEITEIIGGADAL